MRAFTKYCGFIPLFSAALCGCKWNADEEETGYVISSTSLIATGEGTDCGLPQAPHAQTSYLRVIVKQDQAEVINDDWESSLTAEVGLDGRIFAQDAVLQFSESGPLGQLGVLSRVYRYFSLDPNRGTFQSSWEDVWEPEGENTRRNCGVASGVIESGDDGGLVRRVAYSAEYQRSGQQSFAATCGAPGFSGAADGYLLQMGEGPLALEGFGCPTGVDEPFCALPPRLPEGFPSLSYTIDTETPLSVTGRGVLTEGAYCFQLGTPEEP